MELNQQPDDVAKSLTPCDFNFEPPSCLFEPRSGAAGSTDVLDLFEGQTDPNLPVLQDSFRSSHTLVAVHKSEHERD